MIRLLIVDDNAHLRQSLSDLLAGQEDFELVGEAADGIEAIDLVEVLRPDVVVMDAEMPNMDGIQATRKIHSRFPGTNVVGYSLCNMRLRDMVRAGCFAAISKCAPAEDLIGAIRRAASR